MKFYGGQLTVWASALTMALVLVTIGACGGADGDTPTATPTDEPTPTRTFTPTRIPTPTFTPTPTPIPCEASTVRIIGLDKAGEIVTLAGEGDLTGWSIRSDRGGQTYKFPNGFRMTGGTVQVISAHARFGDTATQLWWDTANVWNNSSYDPAVLVCYGNDMQTFGG